ncbi:MAG: PilZ domain-containing protein [Proteobacteria bacterium]|nr:PilZ domain-containing protein [Pseudomonadota bacterium]
MAQSFYKGYEKRQALRISYREEESPDIKIGSLCFKVSDLSENGLQIIISNGAFHDEHLKGLIRLRDGRSIGISGKVIWKKDGKIGVKLITPIPEAVIIREHQLRAEKMDENR